MPSTSPGPLSERVLSSPSVLSWLLSILPVSWAIAIIVFIKSFIYPAAPDELPQKFWEPSSSACSDWSDGTDVEDLRSKFNKRGNPLISSSVTKPNHKDGPALVGEQISISASLSLGTVDLLTNSRNREPGWTLRRRKKKTLVLDLDETLIHSTTRSGRSYDFSVEVLIEDYSYLYYIHKRPHVDYFLRKVARWYRVVIFTASTSEYAQPVIDFLDPTRELISARYFRDSCTPSPNSLIGYCKDLSLVDNDLSSICLIDNSPTSYSINEDNGIPIEGWTDDPKDEALLDLLPFLEALRFCKDVRHIISLRRDKPG